MEINRYQESADFLINYLSNNKSQGDLRSISNEKKVKLLIFTSEVLVKMRRDSDTYHDERNNFFDNELIICLDLNYA